jgi:hypothetical protein
MSSTSRRARDEGRTRIVFGRTAFLILIPIIMVALCRESYPERMLVAGQLAFAMAINAGALAFERHRRRWKELSIAVDLAAGIGMGLAILALVVWQNRGLGL